MVDYIKLNVNNIPEDYPRLSGESFAREIAKKFIEGYNTQVKIQCIFPSSLKKVALSIPVGFIRELECTFPGISNILTFDGEPDVIIVFADVLYRWEKQKI